MTQMIDRRRWNVLMAAVNEAVVAVFDQTDWRMLGLQTGQLERIKGHSRLLRSLNWGDGDYSDHAIDVLAQILRDVGNMEFLLGNEKVSVWLRENKPDLYAEFVADDVVPTPRITVSEAAAALRELLWRPVAETRLTRGFRGRKHDNLLRLLQAKGEARLAGGPRISLLQSLQDAGCDLLFDWDGGVKLGVQLKSHYDISQDDFAPSTLAQIQDSKQHGLKQLYVLLAGDMTDHSHEQKVRGFESRVSKQNDLYLVTVPPERLWTVLFVEEGA